MTTQEPWRCGFPCPEPGPYFIHLTLTSGGENLAGMNSGPFG